MPLPSRAPALPITFSPPGAQTDRYSPLDVANLSETCRESGWGHGKFGVEAGRGKGRRRSWGRGLPRVASLPLLRRSPERQSGWGPGLCCENQADSPGPTLRRLPPEPCRAQGTRQEGWRPHLWAPNCKEVAISPQWVKGNNNVLCLLRL